ncbi:flagellar hook-associated protein 3 FlgL [Lachnospiraceae bacterium KHCPX20]|nr:flagellar hook-associated protein 3 FlgL [Lachnospiraceae bacterium KHCPX20]
MRVTNNMILTNAKSNINGNKVAVDKGNNQMTTQKRIQRPSEDPVIAVRSLRLQTQLSKINQYYEKNIPDAESWMGVSETALLNIEGCMSDIRNLCVTGSTGTLTQDDRNTILTQLRSLQEAVFSQGNASFAGRTVFTGYRTDHNLVFTEEEKDTNYNITQNLSADSMENVSYYNHKVMLPTNEDEINNLNAVAGVMSEDLSIQKSDYYRLRLNYDDITDVENINFSFKQADGTTVDNIFSLAVMNPDTSFDPQMANYDPVTGKMEYLAGVKSADVTRSVYTASGSQQDVTYNYYHQTGTAGLAPQDLYIFENEDDWADWSKNLSGATGDDAQKKYVPEDACVMIKSTGDLLFGKQAASALRSEHANIAVEYDKAGFKKGELRPEFYYDCVNNSDVMNRKVYKLEDERYEINYTIAQDQIISVNQEARDIFNSDIQQDVADLIASVSNTIEAFNKVDKIKAMKKDANYQSKELQEKLDKWQSIAQKEFDYYNAQLGDLFNKELGKADDYLEKINLATTKLGCKGDQVSLTKTRMDEQQQTVTELKSKNDNLDLSEIIINYTAAYTAYQSSLQAAGRLGEMSLLNYI